MSKTDAEPHLTEAAAVTAAAIPLDHLCIGGGVAGARLAKLLAYPTGDIAQGQRRLSWLRAQGVEGICSYGPQDIGGFQALGLGYCGLVLLVPRAGQLLALKLRRMDAPYDSLVREAEAIAMANRFHIGPRLYGHSDDCLLMEYLPGPPFIHWLQRSAVTQVTHGSVWNILQQLLTQAFRLDQAGLDHGDLRCITEHVRIDLGSPGSRPVLIDFGKASQERRPANVTTLTQGLFLSTTVARQLSAKFSETALNCQTEPRRSQLIGLLRAYKNNPCQDAHKTLLNFLKP